MNPSELERQRAVFERASIGVVEASLDGIVKYANRHAMDMLGVSAYEGLALAAFYDDPGLLREQLAARRDGLIGSYRAQMVRQSDGTRIAVQVTAIPMVDEAGRITGSFALLRLPLEEEINRLHQEVEDADSVLFRVMRELRKIIPFDMVTATRFSDDLRHAQTFFVYRPDLPRTRVEWRKRWQSIPPALVADVAEADTLLYRDLPARFAEAAARGLRPLDLVRELIDAKVQTCIRRPIRRQGRIFAAVTFYARSAGGLTEEHRRQVERLPIAASVMQAIEYFDRRRDAERYKLLREVAHCPTIEAVYEALLRRLCDIFLWTNTAIYRVDHARGRVRLIAACRPPQPPVTQGLEYEQDIDEGILGRVVRTGQPQVVADVANDPDFLAGPGGAPVMNSEMCWPIGVEDAKVRWIVDVEDERYDAFCEEERRWLGETAREVGGVMQRLSTLNFLSECLDCTSEPIVVVDAHQRIKRANPAAAELFGVPTAKDVQGHLGALFDSEADLAAVLALPHGYLGEFAVRRRDAPEHALHADVSRRPLPEDIGGAIYVFKDLRPIRRALELELMERTAYEIALETRTPLLYAVSALERCVRDGTPMPPGTAERVLRYLHRARHAYTKLAMFNASVRARPPDVGVLDLAAEVRAIHRSLPDEMRALVRVESDDRPAKVRGDGFQVSFVLETVLLFFVRTAPEEVPVVVSVTGADTGVSVSVDGFLPADGGGAGSPGRDARPELRLAWPLITEFLRANGATCEEQRLAAQHVRYRMCFPPAP